MLVISQIGPSIIEEIGNFFRTAAEDGASPQPAWPPDPEELQGLPHIDALGSVQPWDFLAG
jgi:hypothetical protein